MSLQSPDSPSSFSHATVPQTPIVAALPPATMPTADDQLSSLDAAIERRHLFGVDIDALDMNEAVQVLRGWVELPSVENGPCRFVVTPNVDHMVLLQENQGLRAAYKDAHLVLADGHPVVWASRVLKQPVPERVAGSELVPNLFDTFNRSGKLRVFLLGAAEGVAEVAAQNMASIWPNIQTVGLYSPPMGFEKDTTECANILDRISACKPDVVIVGLGAPKQELWVHQHYKQIDAKVALCVGATIDFLAGEKKRAPVWMQKSGFEWLHRMCSEPRTVGQTLR